MYFINSFYIYTVYKCITCILYVNELLVSLLICVLYTNAYDILYINAQNVYIY